jgi:hypothetical protein
MRTLTLAELIQAKADELRELDNEAGDLMARELDRLAADVRFFGATSPEQYADRKAAWDDYRGRKAG